MFQIYSLYLTILLISPAYSHLTYASSFDLKNLSTGFSSPDGTNWGTSNNYPRYTGDINGDGIPDIIGIGKTTVYVSYGCGVGFSKPIAWSSGNMALDHWNLNFRTPRFIKDYNKDGLDDIIGFAETGIYVLRNTGKGAVYEFIQSNPYTFAGGYDQIIYYRCFGDMNGDGNLDIFAFKNNGVYVRLGNGTHFGAEFKVTSRWAPQGDGFTNFDVFPRHIADANGDGKDDIIAFSIGGVNVARSNGTAYDNGALWINTYGTNAGFDSQTSEPRYLLDVNGDGRMDIFAFSSSVYESISQTSNTYSAATTKSYYGFSSFSAMSTEQRLRIFADVNCDGKDDMIVFKQDNTGVKVFLYGTSSTLNLCKRPTCELCAPSNSSCKLCSNLPIYNINNKCECPAGSSYSDNSYCISSSPSVTIDFNTILCQRVLTATIPTSESSFYSKISVSWNVTSNSTDPVKKSDFYNFITSNTEMNFTVPSSYLEENVLYTFTVSRYTVQGTIISNSTSFLRVSCSSGLTYGCIGNAWGCYECLDNTACTSPSAPYCSSIGQCTGCTGDNDCFIPTPKCDVATFICKQCLSSGDCTTGFCDTSDGKCVACLNTNDCLGGLLCSPSKTCVECIIDTDCLGGDYCNSGTCVPCFLDAHCNTLATPNYRCNLLTNSCQKCLTNSDCASSPATPSCYQGNCYECYQNSDCSQKLQTPVCKFSSKICVGCLSNSDCNGLICDLPSNTCYECTVNNDCTPTKPYCDLSGDRKCKGCLDDDDCNQSQGAPRYCSIQKLCFAKPTVDLIGPSISSGEFNLIFLGYISTTATSYNFVWEVQSSSLDLEKISALNSFVSSNNRFFMEIPFFLLEKGVEYNFTFTYTDINGYTSVQSKHVLPICPNEKYIIIGQGCRGNCSRGCFVCDNPVTCIECAPFAFLNETTLACDMNSEISISSAEKLSPRSKNMLLATINAEEEGYANFQYTWAISSTATSVWTNATDFMYSQNNPVIYLPGTYLRSFSAYTIHVSYINYIYENISTSIDIRTGSGRVPSLQIDGGSYQTLRRNIENVIKLFSTDPEETYATFSALWLQTAGPDLAIRHPTSRYPMWLTIPSCELKEGSLYKFRVSFLVDSTDSANTLDFSARTLNDTYSVDITNGNRSHPALRPLVLGSEVVFNTNCPDIDRSSLLYKWECRNLSTAITQSCSDPSSLFDTYGSNPSITVPTNYFTTNHSFIFFLNVLRGSTKVQASSEISISSPNSLIMEIKCLLSACTKYFSPQSLLLLYSTIQDEPESNLNLLTYTWTITPNISFITLLNKFYLTDNITNPTGSSIKIKVKAENATHQGECYMTMRYNNPPRPGLLTASPSTGEALSTIFELSSKDWLDDDSPLKYHYYYYVQGASPNDKKSLGDPRLHPDLFTVLPASFPFQDLVIVVEVTDFYMAASTLEATVTVTNQASTLDEVQSKLLNLLSLTSTYDTAQMTKSLSLISSQLLITESSLPANGCPLCTGHGSCVKVDLCTCDSGWTGSDCSVSNSTLSIILSLKMNILSRFGDQINSNTDPNLKNIVFSALKDLTSLPTFNNESTIAAAEDMLEKKLDVLSPNTNLTNPQKKDLASVLSNLIEYKSKNDCGCQLQSCQMYATKLAQYFDKISGDSLTIPNLGSGSKVYSTSTYDYIIRQSSICDVESIDLLAPDSTQKLKLVEISKKTHDCSQIVTIKTFSIQDQSDLFDCDRDPTQPKSKSKIGVSVTMVPQNTDISKEYAIVIRNPPTKTCSPKCVTEEQDGVILCNCPRAVDFDPKSQIQSIFSASQIGSLLKFGSLVGWNPAKSPVFWMDLMILSWFVATFYFLGTPKFAKIDIDYMIEQEPTTKRVILYNFLCENQLLAIYFVKDKELSKRMRLAIYFTKILSLGLFNALFGSALQGKGAIEMITNLQILIILLPYWTVLPINIILTILIKKSLKETKTDKKSQKITKIITLAVLIIIILAAFLATFLIAVNNDIDWEYQWLTIIFVNIFMDLVFSPWIKVLFTFAIYYISVIRVSKPVEGLKRAKTSRQVFPIPGEKKISKQNSEIGSRNILIDNNNNNNNHHAGFTRLEVSTPDSNEAELKKNGEEVDRNIETRISLKIKDEENSAINAKQIANTQVAFFSEFEKECENLIDDNTNAYTNRKLE